MSTRYYDAGSGPHDPDSKTNEHGDRNCGCRHNGVEWEEMCQAARAADRELHESVQRPTNTGDPQ